MTNIERMNMMVKNGVLEYGELNIYTHHMCCIYAASILSGANKKHKNQIFIIQRGARSINRVN